MAPSRAVSSESEIEEPRKSGTAPSQVMSFASIETAAAACTGESTSANAAIVSAVWSSVNWSLLYTVNRHIP